MTLQSAEAAYNAWRLTAPQAPSFAKLNKTLQRMWRRIAEAAIAAAPRLVAAPDGPFSTPQQIDQAELIVKIVCDHFGVTPAHLESPSQKQCYTWPRWCAISLLRVHCGLTQELLGVLFNRDHAAIAYSLAHLADAIQTDPKRAAEYATLEQRFLSALNPQPV